MASAARKPADELSAVDVAFLVAVDDEREVERVIGELAREWEGRIDIQLLGPMAAYDFAGIVPLESCHERADLAQPRPPRQGHRRGP